MSASQAGSFNIQEFTDAGDPLVGGRIYTYAQGTTTHKTVYTDRAGEVPHAYVSDGVGGQYVALNARGELPAPLYLAFGSYDICLKTASGATIWTRRADPINRNESASISDFGAVGNGIADDTDAFALAAAASNYVHVPPGSYRVTHPVAVPNLRALTGAPGAKIILDASIGTAFAFTRISGVLVENVTTSVANVSAGSTLLPVVDASLIPVGVYLRLKSAERFHGIPGVSGFGASTKGEYVKVISKSGNTLTLESGLYDGYAGATYPISISLKTFGASLDISGLSVSYDGGIGGNGDTRMFLGEFFDIASVSGVRITGCNFYNMPEVAFRISYSMGINCYGNEFHGPDLALASNLPAPTTQWSKAIDLISCQGAAFTDNVIENMRRGIDPETITTDVICRDIINSNNAVSACDNMIGGHTYQNYVASGNSGTAKIFAYVRGKNTTLIGNTCRASDPWQGIGIGGGVADGESYSGDYSNGVVVIKDNRIMGSFRTGINVRGSVDSFEESGNWIGNCTTYGVAFLSKNIKNVAISGTYRGVPSEDTALDTSYAVAFRNTAEIPIETMSGISVSITTSGKFKYGVGIPGTATGKGAERVYVGDCSFEHLAAHYVMFTPQPGDDLGLAGNQKEPARIGPMSCGNSDAIQEISPPSFGGHWPISAEYWGVLGGSSHELAHYDGATNSGTLQLGLGRTYLRGARRNFNNPTAGSYAGQVCISSGTSGTLAGCAGTITAGTSSLTINDATLVSTGAFISIAGAGIAGAALAAQVVAKTGAVLTLNTPAVTTVSSAAVTWTPSVWRGYGLIAA